MSSGVARVSLEQLGDDPKAVVKRLRGEDNAVVVMEEERPVAVLVSPAGFRRMARERQMLRHLALGELEAAAGSGHSLAEVLAECNMLLEEN